MTSDRQRIARARNWQIRQLRGLHANVRGIISDPDNARIVTDIIDSEIAKLGGETEAERRQKRHDELAKEFDK